MYLTRFEINPARRESRRLLASPHQMHGAVMKSFPAAGREATGEGRILWRVDQRSNQVLLYLVSPAEPDLSHLMENAGWPHTQGWRCRDYTPLLRSLAEGQQWSFRLTANPAHSSRKSKDAPRTQRFGHVTVGQQLTWLLERAERNGFTFPAAAGEEPDVAVHERQVWRFSRDGRTVTLRTAVYEGRLTVSDPTVLRTALVRGIGAAKGYGCGLLTLALARRG